MRLKTLINTCAGAWRLDDFVATANNLCEFSSFSLDPLLSVEKYDM